MTRSVFLRQVALSFYRHLSLSLLLTFGRLGDDTAGMVIISGIRLLVHHELETFFYWNLTDLVRYIGRHPLTPLALLVVNRLSYALGTRIQSQE